MAKKKTAPKAKPAVSYEEQCAEAGYIRLGHFSKLRVAPEEAKKVLLVRDELAAEGAKLDDGTPITTTLHAIRYLISRVEMKTDGGSNE